MTDQSVIELLWKYGHFRNPEFADGESREVTESDLAMLSLNDAAVKEAVRSYQHFMVNDFVPLVAERHSRLPVFDGDVGPATLDLFSLERCAVPDFAVDEATGSGSWPAGCLPDWQNNHAVTISIDKSTMPSFLSAGDRFEKNVWPYVVAAYSEVGLLLVRRDGDPKANLQARWGNSSLLGGGSTIGLAIVPSSTSCQLVIWCRYLNSYNPPDSEHISLWKHEIGHNMRLGHTSGSNSVMNPSIIRGLPVSWRGDPSHPMLVRWFGGEPIPTAPQPPAPPVPPIGISPFKNLLVTDETTGKKYRLFEQASV